MSDLIDRQAVIDVITNAADKWDCPDDYQRGIKAGIRMGTLISSIIPPKQPEQRWIQCNERLPENGYWLWSAKGGEVQKDFYWDGHWEQAEKYGYEVVAWMPLPEPYKEDDYD